MGPRSRAARRRRSIPETRPGGPTLGAHSCVCLGHHRVRSFVSDGIFDAFNIAATLRLGIGEAIVAPDDTEHRKRAVVQRAMYFMIAEFARTARWAESEARRLTDALERHEPLEELEGRVASDVFTSLKTVSHFNLAIALELLLKYLLRWEGIKVPHEHSLQALFCALPCSHQRTLEATFEQVMPDSLELVSLTYAWHEDVRGEPRDRWITSLRDFFEFFDGDAELASMRYVYERFDEGELAFYLRDVSPFLDFIERAPAAIDAAHEL